MKALFEVEGIRITGENGELTEVTFQSTSEDTDDMSEVVLTTDSDAASQFGRGSKVLITITPQK